MIGLSRITVRRLVTVSAVLTLVALALMVAGLFWPSPLLLVLAMSLGQLFGTSSLALYLLAIALDLQGVGEDEALGGGEGPQS
ncbi:hypothetical protein [Anaeromyxobacter terrae]|uniref:hypothetical protein n=1 Tax=Anaeromyxobacter terrae TaxID=2925406 RepID=UPI001F586A89|nr:hypothetical protein [Anaeromyxobacter sp. SG22]